VNAAEALGDLRRLGSPVIATREATARLRVSPSRTTQILRALERSGLVKQLRHGLWLIDTDTDPFTIPPYLTAPYPSYVSLFSALSAHGIIEQIPHQVFVVSLDRPATITTSIATYSIHHVAPEVFGGFTRTPQGAFIATPEKALFDTVYSRTARHQAVHLPEIELPAGFNDEEALGWLGKIKQPGLATVTKRELERVLTAATRTGRG
jgi:predicted transcriptional regulator of viral defense system